MPRQISATPGRQRPAAQTDDWAHVVLDYADDDKSSALQPACCLRQPAFQWLFMASMQAVMKRLPDQQEAQLLAGLKPGDQGWGVDADFALLYDGSGSGPREIETRRGDYREFYRAIARALTAGGPNPVTAEEAINVMTIMEAAVRSSDRGQKIPV